MSRPRVAIIDYKMCNLFSVEHACRYVGADPVITSRVDDIDSADAVILPGVGAFKDALENVRLLGLDKAIHRSVSSNKPFLAICLGFQMLFSSSEEFGYSAGLGIFSGKVLKFPHDYNGCVLKVPQIGWNSVNVEKQTIVLSGITDGELMYFVHSFYVVPEDLTIVSTSTIYNGFKYCSSVSKGKLFACQFHPEKSSQNGIRIYSNWISTI